MNESRRYELVARQLLDKFKEYFGLECVEGAQSVKGTSGTTWRLDAKAVPAGDGGFLIVECRRYTTSRLDQEALGGLCYRIWDTGARGGITVSPHDLQRGAKIIAEHENVRHVQLTPSSDLENYFLQFLNRAFVGVTETCNITITEQVHVLKISADGTTEEWSTGSKRRKDERQK